MELRKQSQLRDWQDERVRLGTALDNDVWKCLSEMIFELRSEWSDGKGEKKEE